MAHGSEHGDDGRASGTGGSGGSSAASPPGGTPPTVTGAGTPEPTTAESTPTPPAAGGMAAKPLESLSPSFDEDQHGTYLRRLEEAVADPRNRNIALTGRYGAGKSSVLDQFQANHADSTLRLAISSLTPGTDAEDQGDDGDGDGDERAPGVEVESTTNQIQKDIVKQLLYGASEKVGRNSRFRRIAVLGRWRAFAQSLGFVVCVGGLLYLFGWLPPIKWAGDNYDTWQRVLAWALVAALATILVTVVRVLTAGRFQVAEFSAGGAALTLDKSPDSYFDKFLDEIVYYFGRESKDIVIFEDLDRFEDPGIFEALRELNLLLNETPERRRRRNGNRLGHALRRARRRRVVNWAATKTPARLSAWMTRRVPGRLSAWLFGTGRPLRFVYALRDSVFEKLDAETAAAAAQDGQRIDAAAAETMRANRTKFFDIVISIVPFISHRNARDLLAKMLDKRGITDIEPRLVNIIAQHCTDMRLMRNMCNEYLVFAERLMEPNPPYKPAPGMNASHLFALVAYKNFHLSDFENITRRASALDRLYELHQKLVRDNIDARDAQKRHLLAEPERDKTQASTAAMLGERLTTHAELVRRTSPYSGHQAGFRVGSQAVELSALGSYEFWGAVAQNGGFTMVVAGSTVIKEFDKTDLAVFFPEALDADRWGQYDEDAARNQLADIATDIEDLRRADFADLVRMPRFKLTGDTEGNANSGEVETEPRTFRELLEETLPSELACDLVRREYIDRNFSLYAAQFYGNFTGVDVATFMVQHVQSNTPAIDYDLSRDGAVANLLAEARDAGEELTETVAAFNIDIVNHLLAKAHPDAGTVVDNLIAGWGSNDISDFLAAYFTDEHAEREKLAALLTEHGWREVFTYLATDDGVPADARAVLFSAAASTYRPKGGYDLDDDVRTFITARYGDMLAFTIDHSDRLVPERLHALLKDGHVVIPDLRPLGTRLQRLVVSAKGYDLTADNLRSALGIADGGTGHPTSVPLDVIHDNDAVYAYCLEHLPTYLKAIDADNEVTQYAVASPETLVVVLDDLIDNQTSTLDDVIDDLLAHTAPGARLTDLRAAQEVTWSALADAGLFRASLANMSAYRNEFGIDVHLASLLKAAGTVYATDPEDYEDQDGDPCDREDAALALLGVAHLNTEVRVNLAVSVGAATPLPVESIPAESNDLFALLLGRQMVSDTSATFVHLREGGWAALKPAILASADIGTWLEHSVVDGMVADILEDPETATKVGRKIVDHVEDFVPTDDWSELKAVARYAGAHRIPLAPDTVVRIARVGAEHGDARRDLLLNLLSETVPAVAASHIVDVFDQLGPDYDKVRQTGETLEFDRADPHDQLLKVLKAANLVSGTRGTKKHFRVTVN